MLKFGRAQLAISDEFVRIAMLKSIVEGEHRENSPVLLGVEGLDDAALVKITEDTSLVVASDFVRGSGFYLFQLGHLDYLDIGYYLIVANLSDLAAMGARPTGITTIIRYSKEMTDDQFQAIFRGMDAAAKDYATEIVGGDIGGYSEDVFAATAFGFVKTSRALLRSRAHAGDLLCVTGTVGLPITALLYYKEVKQAGFQLSQDDERRILASWRRPKARIAEGALLAETGFGHACQDISDGLKSTVEQVSALSGRTFTVRESALPIDPATRAMADFLRVSAAQIAVSASVDFELLFTISPAEHDLCRKAFSEHGLGFHIIGEVNELGKNIFVSEDGEQHGLPGVAWAQQTSDYLGEIIGRH
jgi:thiamine-monophosphate kinase